MKEFEIIDDSSDSYTVIRNIILRSKDISNGSIGLLCKIFSLPPDWDYSFNGLVAISKEGRTAVQSQLKELKAVGLVYIKQYKDSKGRFKTKYTVYKNKRLDPIKNPNSPHTGFPYTDNPLTENQQQLITNNKDKIDKEDKTPSLSILTKELIRLKYINENDIDSFLFDDLFKEYLNAGYTVGELLGSTRYIVHRVLSRDFIDDNGNEIINKFNYFKTSLSNSINRLRNNIEDPFKDYELDEGRDL